MDQKELKLGQALQAKGTAITAVQDSITLVACAPTQVSFSGPLVPGQNIASSNSNLSDITPNEKIPKNEWSTRAGFSISSPADPEYWAGMLGSG